ncbi:MAG: molybdopterin molybdotransferase MoeA [Bacteroidota bacterium]
MTSLQEAQQLVKQQAHSFGKEIVLLDEAVGRVLNEPVVADRDYPPFNRATMDGIAINSRDWNDGIRTYTLAETIFAGMISTKSINKGECYKIMTGAAVPAGANTVIRKEDVEENENRLTVTVSEIKPGQNIALMGSDIKKGVAVINASQMIREGTVTTLASLGYDEVKVASLPSVAIITTGDEIVPVHAPVNEVQIRNSNQHLLKALLHRWEIRPTTVAHVKDNAAALLQVVNKHKQSDILILSGAVSAGDADFVPEVLIQAGAKMIFHKVAIRPGKPIWFGKFDNGALVFALPGNPFSTFVTFKLFIEEFLFACFGLPERKMLQLPFNGTRVKKTNLDEFFPVMIGGNPTSINTIVFNTSGDITAVLTADALAQQPNDKMEIKESEIISCFTV